MKRRAISGILPQAVHFHLLIVLCIFLQFSLWGATLQAQNLSRTDAPSLYSKGRDALQKNELYRAIDFFKESLQKNSNYVEPLRGLARVYFRMGEYGEAEEYISKARSLAKNDTETAALQGRIYTGMGRVQEAADLFSSILRKEPNNLDAQFGLAELQVVRGRLQNAIEVYRNALDSYPRNERALLSAALLYQSRGEYEEARELIRKAVRYNPDDVLVRSIAAELFFEAGDLQNAVRNAEKALSEDQGNRRALGVLIDAYFSRGEYENAIPVLEKSFQDTEEAPLIRYALGKAQAEVGNVDAALNAFTGVLRMRPDDEVTRIVMENILLDSLPPENEERIEAAEHRFDKAQRYEENYRTRMARQEYRRGIELAPYHAEGRLGYAEIFKRTEDYGKYLSLLRYVVEEGKNNQDIQDELEIYTSMNEDTVSADWKVDQFAIERDRYRVVIFADTRNTRVRHIESEMALLKYQTTLLHGYEQIKVDKEQLTDSFAESFRTARNRNADYFILFSFVENERSFTVEARIYYGKTGTELERLEVYRTGNNRVVEASMRLIRDIQDLFPSRGRIYRREGDQVLLDIGSFHGIRKEDTLEIIRSDDIELKSRDFGFAYNPDDILGQIEVSRTDELVSEGSIQTAGFFDLINPNDVVFKTAENEDNGNETTPEDEVDTADSDTSGGEENINSSAIYKSLLEIR